MSTEHWPPAEGLCDINRPGVDQVLQELKEFTAKYTSEHGDELDNESSSLKSAVTMLEAMRNELFRTREKAEHMSKSKRYQSVRLVRWMMSAWKSRDKKYVHESLKHSVLAAFPGSFGQTLVRTMDSCRRPSASTMQRGTTRLDWSFMCYHADKLRDLLSQPGGISTVWGADNVQALLK